MKVVRKTFSVGKKIEVLDFSKKSVVHEAAARLGRYVEKYPEYNDRDRDIILLHLLSLAEKRH